MIMLSVATWTQSAGAVQAADSSAVMSAGIGTGSELALVAILAVALVGGAIAMLAGDRVRRSEAARRPAEWGE
jgi:hypothetical protein